MSTLINSDTQYADEATGELINNGFIYIGLDGLDAKLNPAAIYSDRELTTVLANPQRTGPDGRSVNKIWVDGKYSMKIENSANVQKLNRLTLGELSQTGTTNLVNVQGADSLTADASPTITALENNQIYILTAAANNTGAMTLTIDLTPTWPIKKHHDQDMQADDVEAGQSLAVIFNETDSVYELMTNSAIGPVNLANAQTIGGVKTFSDPTIFSDTASIAGTLSLTEGANIASASDCDIWANLDGNTVHLTGTTPVLDWGTAPQAGSLMRVICDAATPLTYNATTNDLNTGGVSYTTNAGDVLAVYARSASSYQVTIYPANGAPIAPLTTRGDIMVQDSSTPIRLAIGTADQVLKSDGLDLVWGEVDQAALGASSVGQSELKTTTGEQSTSSATEVSITLSGGAYGFYPQIRHTSAVAYYGGDLRAGTTTSSTPVTTVILHSSSGTAYIRQEYIQASPPYDLGDGEIPLFIFATINNSTGLIESLYLAPEAPWHYNGKTDIRATRKDGGRAWRSCCRAQYERVENNINIKQLLSDPSTIQQGLDIINDKKPFEIEITQAVKQADMIDIPHPFLGNDLTGKTVVMLDPVSPIAEQLLNLHNSGESVSEILHDGYITYGNTQIARATPNDVMCVSLGWKNKVN